MKRFIKRKLLFLPLPAWIAIAFLLVVGGLVGAYVFTQVTSESEVVEPLEFTDVVHFDEQIWPCYSSFLTFDVENDAPVPYGLRLSVEEATFPDNVHFGELLVSGDPYTWGETAEMPANGAVECSIEVVAECDAAEGLVAVTINVERAAPGAPPPSPTAPTPTPGVPWIAFSPWSFSFEAQEGGANPASQTLSIRNSSGGTLDWSVSDNADWLDLAPTSGSSTGETDDVTVSVDITGMSAGDFGAVITISAPGATNTPRDVWVHLAINPGPTPTPPLVPQISFSPSSFAFHASDGGADPPSRTLTIWNSGGGTLDWSVSDDADWLDLAPTSGSSTGETADVTVSVDITGVSAGEYNATITITAPEATNTPVDVPVSLSIAVMPGDANGDGKVDVFDLVKVKRIILGLDPATPGADANHDGEIDVLDLVKIKRIILGIAPCWSVGDEWEYLSAFPRKPDSVFTVTVEGEEEAEGVDCYYTMVDMDPPAERYVFRPMDTYITIDGSEMWVAKATLDNVREVVNITAPIPLPVTNTWVYTGDHGWPFEMGKSWSYDKTTATALGTYSVTWTVTVEGIEDVTVPAGTFSCYHIVHRDPDTGYTMYEQWWSGEIKNNVKTIDYASYSDAETQELQSYSLAP